MKSKSKHKDGTTTIQTCFQKGKLETYYDGRCKWCGKPFHKKTNKSQYCSRECAKNKTRENKARYQAKRRKRIREKVLILPEYKSWGMGSYGTMGTGHRKKSFKEEYEYIQQEKKRLGLKRRKPRNDIKFD